MHRGFRLSAHFTSSAAPSGTLCALGDWIRGWAWYAVEGRLVYTCQIDGRALRVETEMTLGPGQYHATIEFESRAPSTGVITMRVGGSPVATLDVPESLPARWQNGHPGLLIGRDEGFPVSSDYVPPFPFVGTLHRVEIDVPSADDPAGPREADLTALRHD
jgi:arylsulfatase